jgi:hypothetical protein
MTASLGLIAPCNWYTLPLQIRLPASGRWPVLIKVSTPNGRLARAVDSAIPTRPAVPSQ